VTTKRAAGVTRTSSGESHKQSLVIDGLSSKSKELPGGRRAEEGRGLGRTGNRTTESRSGEGLSQEPTTYSPPAPEKDASPAAYSSSPAFPGTRALHSGLSIPGPAVSRRRAFPFRLSEQDDTKLALTFHGKAAKLDRKVFTFPRKVPHLRRKAFKFSPASTFAPRGVGHFPLSTPPITPGVRLTLFPPRSCFHTAMAAAGGAGAARVRPVFDPEALKQTHSVRAAAS